MKCVRKVSFFVLPLLVLGLKVSAETTPAPTANPALMEERQKFELQLRDENMAFNKKMMDDRKTFMDTLKGKSEVEKNAALKDYNAKQMPQRKSFMDAQFAKRNEFRKAHGMPPLPTPEERRAQMEKTHQSVPVPPKP